MPERPRSIPPLNWSNPSRQNRSKTPASTHSRNALSAALRVPWAASRHLGERWERGAVSIRMCAEVSTMRLPHKFVTQKRLADYSRKPLFLLVPRAGIEPARRVKARDFKSRVSTNSTTEARTA